MVKIKAVKKILSALFIAYSLQFTCLAGRQAAYSLFAQDKIVAIVNSSVITQKDLNDFTNFMRMQFSANLKGEKLESKIQSMKLDLLDKLIEDQLILQEAKRLKLKANEERIRAKIKEIKSGFDSDAEFHKELAKQGLVQADIEEKLREQLLMQNIIGIKVRRNILVNPAEVTNFYNKNISEFMVHEERELESINLKDENLAKEIADSLKAGQGLSDLAKKYSLDLNTFTVTGKEELKKDIAEAIFKLKPGETQGPFKIEEDYYFFRLNQIKLPRQQKLSEAQERIYGFLFEEKIQQELLSWLDELKKKSFIKIMQD